MSPFSPLAGREILDAGYHEFMVTPEFAEELLAGGMTHVNGERVRLEIVDRLPGVNAVVIRYTPAERVRVIPQDTYAWQMAA